jgi:hypothetical protein
LPQVRRLPGTMTTQQHPTTVLRTPDASVSKFASFAT